jgi:O-antigen ligase
VRGPLQPGSGACYCPTVTDASSKPRVPIAVAVALAFIVVQDTLNTLVGAQGAVTIAVAGVLAITGIATFAADRTALSTRAVPFFMQLFLVWATVRFAMAPSSVGLQNLLVWFIFPATIGVVYARSQRGSFERTYPWWKWLSVVASIVYLLEVLRSGVGAGSAPYSARGAGWVCVFALVLVVPVTAAKRASWWPAGLLVAVIALSLSRTPLAIAAVLLIIVIALRPFKRQRPSSVRVMFRFLVMTSLVAVAAYLLVTRVDVIRDRFTQGDGYSFGGVEINSSGRSVLWSLTIDQWKQSPWIGHGPGSAQIMITKLFPGWISHPHNEYLRFLDDTGVVGLTLWGLGMVMLLARAVQSVVRTSEIHDRSLHIAAALSVLVILLGSITDNLTVYIYCAMIAGSVIGMSARRAEDALSGTHTTQASISLGRTASTLPGSAAMRR